MFKTILENLPPLFLLMAAGYVLGKTKIINAGVSAGLSSILLGIALPSTIIMSMQREFSYGLLLDGAKAFIFSLLLPFIMAGAGLMLCRLIKIPSERKGVCAFALAFGNISFMGFPIIEAIYGQEALFFVSAANVAFYLLTPTLGAYVLNPGIMKERGRRKLPFNAPLVSALLGLALFLFRIRLPGFAGTALSMAGGMTTPLSMLIVGAILAQNSIKSVFGNFRIYIIAAVKLLAAPLLLLAAFRLFAIGTVVSGVLVYLSAMPSAALTVVYSEKSGADSAFASNIVFISTLLSLLTLPVISLL